MKKYEIEKSIVLELCLSLQLKKLKYCTWKTLCEDGCRRRNPKKWFVKMVPQKSTMLEHSAQKQKFVSTTTNAARKAVSNLQKKPLQYSEQQIVQKLATKAIQSRRFEITLLVSVFHVNQSTVQVIDLPNTNLEETKFGMSHDQLQVVKIQTMARHQAVTIAKKC